KDPHVLAIRQTLYRAGADSEIVEALADVARRGKEVTVVIELRARFSAAENLELASRLQEAGVIVVYGVVGYKTHAKMILIVRREEGKLRRYVHLGTGNYHAGNARLYTDYSFLTCDESIGDDVNKLFQQLTGMGKALKIKKLFHAPFTLHNRLISLIEREASFGDKGRIIFKFNALTEAQMIKALYRASQAGVKIDLIIRGICCLRPEVPGLSDNIRVRSIIGRFLEHTRVYYFGNDGRPEVYCSSADGMERNLLNRIETAFPIEEPALVARLREDLDTYLADNCQSWVLQPDGSYIQNQPAEREERLASQLVLLERLTVKSSRSAGCLHNKVHEIYWQDWNLETEQMDDCGCGDSGDCRGGAMGCALRYRATMAASHGRGKQYAAFRADGNRSVPAWCYGVRGFGKPHNCGSQNGGQSPY